MVLDWAGRLTPSVASWGPELATPFRVMGVACTRPFSIPQAFWTNELTPHVTKQKDTNTR